MALIYPGYRGFANIAGVGDVRFSDANITAKQEVRAEDLIMGDWDHDAYVYGKIEVGGSISGPVTETFVSGSGGGSGLWDWGVVRNGTCGTLTEDTVVLNYYCGGSENKSRTFGGMLVNSVNFSCSAGDIAQFSLDLMGKSAGAWSTTDPALITTAEKLITWDKVLVSVPGSSSGPGSSALEPASINYSNFDFTISNNLEPVYSLAQADLFPVEIVPGLRSISGTLSVYNIPQADGVETWDSYLAADLSQIDFDIGGLTISMFVQFHRIEPSSRTGPIVSTVGFTGVGHQTGVEWVA